MKYFQSLMTGYYLFTFHISSLRRMMAQPVNQRHLRRVCREFPANRLWWPTPRSSLINTLLRPHHKNGILNLPLSSSDWMIIPVSPLSISLPFDVCVCL